MKYYKRRTINQRSISIFPFYSHSSIKSIWNLYVLLSNIISIPCLIISTSLQTFTQRWNGNTHPSYCLLAFSSIIQRLYPSLFIVTVLISYFIFSLSTLKIKPILQFQSISWIVFNTLVKYCSMDICILQARWRSIPHFLICKRISFISYVVITNAMMYPYFLHIKMLRYFTPFNRLIFPILLVHY